MEFFSKVTHSVTKLWIDREMYQVRKKAGHIVAKM